MYMYMCAICAGRNCSSRCSIEANLRDRVIGGGLAGLAFAIRARQLGRSVCVLESGFNDSSRAGSYSHSLSLKKDSAAVFTRL